MAKRISLESTRPSASVTGEMIDFVGRSARAFKNTTDHQEIAKLAARMPVPEIADFAVLFASATAGERIIEVAHRDPSLEAGVRRAVEAHREALEAAAGRVAGRHGTARSQWITAVNPRALTLLFGHDTEILQMAQDLNVTSLLLHPLNARGRAVGLLALARVGESPAYEAGELSTGLVFARRAALALDDARIRNAENADWIRGARLDEALDKWAHTFEAATWGAVILDAVDWRIEAANPAFAHMHGYDQPDALVGRLITDFIAPPQRPDIARRLTEHPREPVTVEILQERRDGSVFPALVSFTVVHGPEGQVLYRSAHLQDLTELRRAEARLQSAQRMEAVGRLAGGVAHEVNNMMTIVLGFADFLLRDETLGREHRDDVEEMRRAAERAAGITQQLLAFSRRQVMQASVLDLNEVVRGAAQLLRTLLPANVQLETDLDAEEPWIRVDQTQIEQVIINLAFNARDAMPEGGTLSLTTSVKQLERGALQERIGISVPPGEYVTLEISDTGMGMDRGTLAHVFEPFFTTKGVGKGTGLGLSTVYGIVKQSGGYVTVRSEAGAGTSFCVFLPRVAAEPDAPTGIAGPHDARGTETVLVVEDEEVVRSLAGRVLREHGYRTLEATDGGAALELLAERSAAVDLILTDVVMPLMGGRELRERLLALGIRIPVLFMSAYTGDDVMRQGLIDAGDMFVQKPFTPMALTARVREALDASRGSVVRP